MWESWLQWEEEEKKETTLSYLTFSLKMYTLFFNRPIKVCDVLRVEYWGWFLWKAPGVGAGASSIFMTGRSTRRLRRGGGILMVGVGTLLAGIHTPECVHAFACDIIITVACIDRCSRRSLQRAVANVSDGVHSVIVHHVPQTTPRSRCRRKTACEPCRTLILGGIYHLVETPVCSGITKGMAAPWLRRNTDFCFT